MSDKKKWSPPKGTPVPEPEADARENAFTAPMGAPVPEPEGPGIGDQAMDALKFVGGNLAQGVDNLYAGAVGAGDALTLGTMPKAYAAMEYPFDRVAEAIGQFFNPDFKLPTYDERVAENKGEIDAVHDSAPGHFNVGGLLGAVRSGGPLASLGSEVGTNIVSKVATNPKVQQYLGQTAVGAGVGGLDAYYHDRDPTTGALLGGAGGALGEFFSSLGGHFLDAVMPSQTTIKEGTRARIEGPISARAGGQSIDDLIAARKALGDDAMVADASPAYLNAMSQTIPDGATNETVQALTNAVRSRGGMAEDSAFDALRTTFTGPTRKAAEAMTKQNLDTLSKTYADVTQQMDASAISYRPTAVKKLIADTFGDGATGNRAVMRDRFLKIVDDRLTPSPKIGPKGEVIPQKPKLELSPTDVVAIRKELDASLRSYVAEIGDPAIKKEMSRDLSTIRKTMADRLSADFPEFGDIMKDYADEFTAKAAFDDGVELAKSPNKVIAADAIAEYNALPTMAKAAYEAGLSSGVVLRMQNNGGVKVLRQTVGKQGGNALSDNIEAIFGPEKAEQLLEAAQRVETVTNTNNVLDKALDEAGKNANKSTSALVQKGRIAADAATAATAPFMSGLMGGAAQGSVKRLSAAAGININEAINDELSRIGGLTGQDADEALEQLKMYMQGRVREQPWNAGALPGAVMNAGSR